ncbi:unnamed protein product [Pedinophyceae sp. YPF-701]|nr:unnamed protein product [Pedinophyceae sp. YPF-701]
MCNDDFIVAFRHCQMTCRRCGEPSATTAPSSMEDAEAMRESASQSPSKHCHNLAGFRVATTGEQAYCINAWDPVKGAKAKDDLLTARQQEPRRDPARRP